MDAQKAKNCMENGSNTREINAPDCGSGVHNFYPGNKPGGNILEIVLNGQVPSIPGFL